MPSDRCNGHCCRHFFLPFSPAGLKAAAEHTREVLDFIADHGELAHRPGRLAAPYWPDAPMVADMAVYLGQQAPGTVRTDPVELQPTAGIYTCRHLQPNGDCGVYEHRPRMCREYPYGNTCEWGDACTWTEGRIGPLREWREDSRGRRLHLTLAPKETA